MLLFSSTICILLALLGHNLALGSPTQSIPANCLDLHCWAMRGEQNERLVLLQHENYTKELLDVDGKQLEKCRTCQDCTRNGYSVCINLLQQSVRGEMHCECAHSGPFVQQEFRARNAIDYGASPTCAVIVPTSKLPTDESNMVEGEADFRVCYESALRKLPALKARNDKEIDGHPVVVSVDQFWRTDYWIPLRPRNLKLYYVFPVTVKEHCEALTLVPTVEDMVWINAEKKTNSSMTWLCKSDLYIEMSGLERESESSSMEYYEPDPEPPEVQFERDVFAGADRVRFYYEVKLHRDHQWKSVAGKMRFESRAILLRSDTLDFELYSKIDDIIGLDQTQNQTTTTSRPSSSTHNYNESGIQLQLNQTDIVQKECACEKLNWQFVFVSNVVLIIILLLILILLAVFKLPMCSVSRTRAATAKESNYQLIQEVSRK